MKDTSVAVSLAATGPPHLHVIVEAITDQCLPEDCMVGLVLEQLSRSGTLVTFGEIAHPSEARAIAAALVVAADEVDRRRATLMAGGGA